MLEELNDPTQVVTLKVLNQANLYSSVVHGMKAEPINIDLALREWGKTQEPYEAYYGQVAASDVAEWYDQHYPRLFSPNIRTFLGDTSVNQSIRETLSSEPEKFWYYNNGITALSENIEKKPIGGSARESGLFECKDFKIVNGAQTVGAVFDAYSQHPDKLDKALVPVRIISLEQTPKDFDKSVTKYNNTQNQIERRDFVSLDSQQERLKTELQVEGIEYAYKSGQSVGGSENGFDLEEATIALACSQSDVRYCVYAKREIGMLWEDIEEPPYRVLFNPSLDGIHLWKLVQALRCVEDTLQLIEKRSTERAKLLAVHGKRFVEHLVYQETGDEIDEQDISLDSEFEESVREIANTAYNRVLKIINSEMQNAYLGSLFKNSSRCQRIKNKYLGIGQMRLDLYGD